eukprot:3287693-Rhodomonas_salina.3
MRHCHSHAHPDDQGWHRAATLHRHYCRRRDRSLLGPSGRCASWQHGFADQGDGRLMRGVGKPWSTRGEDLCLSFSDYSTRHVVALDPRHWTGVIATRASYKRIHFPNPCSVWIQIKDNPRLEHRLSLTPLHAAPVQGYTAEESTSLRTCHLYSDTPPIV